MRPSSHRCPVVLLCVLLFLIGCSKIQKPSDPAASKIRNRLSPNPAEFTTVHGADPILASELLRQYYERRNFNPAWSDEHGISASADSLVALVKIADQEGLEPQDYHLDGIERILGTIRSMQGNQASSDISGRAELDLLLSDAFILYACHLSEGKVDRDSLRPRLTIGREKQQYVTMLEKALSTQSVGQTLRSSAPGHTAYRALRGLLMSFRSQEKHQVWTHFPAGISLRPGQQGRFVFALRSRLLALGDLSPRSGSTNDEFDSTLVDAVRVFQKRHGFETSGVADSATIAALNVPPSNRVAQIKATMERWRWLPHALGQRHVLINIPDFRLSVVENDRVVMSMKVVLGLPAWQTPMFSSELTQVLFNTHWMAPEDIVEKELINYMKADTNYLPSNSMSLWRKKGDSLQRLDPHTINWREMSPEKIDFFLRQEGGPQNIMGQVKFPIPNKYNVYLHDTPYREDFPKSVRMFSHGCIRLEKPFDLAEYVLRQFPAWTRERIDTVVARRMEQTITLKTSIPVHVVYCTVWRGEDGSAQFREDYYGLDRRLSDILRRPASK
jgi:murein L,D-transpeptidase YcbB/YkuD